MTANLSKMQANVIVAGSVGIDPADRPHRPKEAAVPTVSKVRKELSASGTHRHIEGVCTIDGTHYTRRQVVEGIARGESWTTRSPSGSTATIRPLERCTTAGCPATPYITTRADNQKDDNLENLPSC